MRHSNFISLFACADNWVTPEEYLSRQPSPNVFSSACERRSVLQKKKIVLGGLKYILSVVCCLSQCVNTLEFCGLLASGIILPNKELPEKMFITTEAHGFSQFHSNEFKVYCCPMSHFVWGLMSHFVRGLMRQHGVKYVYTLCDSFMNKICQLLLLWIYKYL